MAPTPNPAEQPVDGPIEPPWWRPPRASRRRQPLSRAAIIDAAIKILDAEGLDALTVRRLGDELGTGSATLYWHIGSKDELGELVYDHVMGGIALPAPDPSHWQAQIKDLARQAYRLMLAHNDLVRLSVGRVPVGPNMLRVMEWTVGLLRAAGIPDQPAAYFGDIFGRYLDASVLEVTAHGGPPIEQVGQYFRSLPPDQFPNMMAVSRAMFTGTDDDRFEFGLDLLVNGLAALVPTSITAPRSPTRATKRSGRRQ
jgi:AcrR family transcriptional regulator